MWRRYSDHYTPHCRSLPSWAVMYAWPTVWYPRISDPVGFYPHTMGLQPSKRVIVSVTKHSLTKGSLDNECSDTTSWDHDILMSLCCHHNPSPWLRLQRLTDVGLKQRAQCHGSDTVNWFCKYTTWSLVNFSLDKLHNTVAPSTSLPPVPFSSLFSALSPSPHLLSYPPLVRCSVIQLSGERCN